MPSVIRGAREHNLKNIDLAISRATSSSSSPASRAPASRRSPSTRSSPRGSGATSNRSRPTRGSSSSRWKSRTSTRSTGSRPRSRSSRRRRRRNPRSTVGTVTEIYDYLRLLFASVGIPHCPNCGQRDPAADRAADGRPASRLPRGDEVPGPRAVRARQEGRVPQAAVARWSRQGFLRARVDGKIGRPRRPPDARQAEEAHDRHRHRPSGRQARTRGVPTSASPIPWRRRLGSRSGLVVLVGARRARGARSRRTSRARLRHVPRRDHAAPVLVQLALTAPARPAPASGRPHGGRPREARDRSRALDRRRRDGALPAGLDNWRVAADRRRSRSTTSSRLDDALRQALEGGAEGHPVRVRRRRDQVRVQVAEKCEYHWAVLYEGLVPMLERRYRETESGAARRSSKLHVGAACVRPAGGGGCKPEALAVTWAAARSTRSPEMTVSERRASSRT